MGIQRVQMRNKGLKKTARRACRDERRIKKTSVMAGWAKSANGTREIGLSEKGGVSTTAQRHPLTILKRGKVSLVKKDRAKRGSSFQAN